MKLSATIPFAGKYFLLALLLAILTITSPYYTQQSEDKEERSLQPQLTRDQSLFPLQSTGIWTEVHPLIPRVAYWGVHFVNDNTGWAVGAGGAIIKTTNGGQRWIWYESGVGNTLRTVYAVNNGQRVIAAGDGGKILLSEDSGETWTQLSSPTIRNLWNMQMITEQIGWMVGETGAALKTTDGGYTWIQQPMPYPNSSYWDVSFVNTNLGYISCPSGIVIKTTNGGGNWITQVAGDTRSLWTIYAIDSMKVCAGGFAGKLVYTSNGGNTWIPLWDYGISYNKITFADSLVGIGAGNGSIRTTDGGLTWYLLNIHNITDNNVVFAASGVGYMVGNSMSLLKSSDKGAGWIRTIFNGDWHDVHFINEMKGYFINYSYGYEGLYKTEDGGVNYYKVEDAPGGGELYFIDSLTGFIGGNLIYKTTDGGETWYTTQGSGGAGKIIFINLTIGWAIRSNKIYKTTDSGENWFTQLTAPLGNFTGIYFVDSLYGWVSGGRPHRTTDGGQSWIQQTNTIIWNSDDIYFTNSDTGWIGKYSSINNSLFKTIDSGISWAPIPEVIGARKFHFFPDPIHWMTIGFSRYYITNDYGNSWIEFTEDVPTGLVSFDAANNALGYSVGSMGLILRYDDTTYVPVELISFKGIVEGNEIVLSWITASELNNQGFFIEKSFDKINWETIGFVNGHGTTTKYSSYIFVDIQLINEQIYYRLKQVDYNGSFTYSKIVYITFPIIDFSLLQNFPNPANPSTCISFSLPIKTKVEINLFSISGELVKEILNEEKDKGRYNVNINLSYLASGIYFYRMTTNKGYSNVKKLILLK